jgi:hypothetical protein
MRRDFAGSRLLHKRASDLSAMLAGIFVIDLGTKHTVWQYSFIHVRSGSIMNE